MRPRQSRSTAVAVFSIFLTLLLAMALAAQAQAQKFKVLHTFHGKDGAAPSTQLIRDAAGNFYGTTSEGGTGVCKYGNYQFGCGTAFKLDDSGHQVWLHSFHFESGADPMAGLLRDKAGNFDGTTKYGGDTNCNAPVGCGTVFRVDSTGKEAVLHKFSGTPDGQFPSALLVEDEDGNLYGTTAQGGTYSKGTVFKVDSSGNESTLYNFTGGSDGGTPNAGVIRDKAGTLYGVTGTGGGGHGTVFTLDTNDVETVLYDFSGEADGAGPTSVLLMDSEGNLYGTTTGGGSNQGECAGLGCGVVFRLAPTPGGAWTETTLYTFNGNDGQFPEGGPLVRDASGNLYGTTYFGGQSSGCNGTCGVVFKLDKVGRGTVLHNFTGRADGGCPFVGLSMDKAGNLYGSTQIGGDHRCPFENGYGCGVIFTLTP